VKRLVFLLLVIFCLSSCSNRSDRLYIFNWTYYIPQSILTQFEQEYGIRIIYDEYASNEEMYAKLVASRRATYDIVFPSEDYVEIMMRSNMLSRLDHSKLPNLRYINPRIQAKLTFDPGMNYSVPYFMGTAGIIVNTLQVPEFPRSWSIFADTTLAGRMTMLDDMRETMGAALMYLGYSASTRNAAEIERATEHIRNVWRPNLVRFDAEAFGKAYAMGDFWVVHGYPEVVFEEIADNPELFFNTYFFIPEEGGTSYLDSMVILRNARNKDAAHKFINFIHRPDIYAQFVDSFNFPADLNLGAIELKEGWAMFELEDIIYNELKYCLGEYLDLYTNAWFNRIRLGL